MKTRGKTVTWFRGRIPEGSEGKKRQAGKGGFNHKGILREEKRNTTK